MDPQDYTPADDYAQYVADNMPDLTEVSAAALALIKALCKLADCKLVTRVDPVGELADRVAEIIPEALNFDEDDRFSMCIRDEVTAATMRERRLWLAAIKRDEVDASLTKQTLDLANMVQGILGAKS